MNAGFAGAPHGMAKGRHAILESVCTEAAYTGGLDVCLQIGEGELSYHECT